jgi:large subunit ribosomal protein L9
MEVILAESMHKLGDEGDIVKVKAGYARNYLIPQGLAFPVKTTNANEVAHKRKLVLDQQRKKVKTQQDLARHISKTEVSIAVKVGDEDKLFGSVTSQHIQEELKRKGFDVDRRKIMLDEPIKALGVYTVQVRFTADIQADVKVWVVKEN